MITLIVSSVFVVFGGNYFRESNLVLANLWEENAELRHKEKWDSLNNANCWDNNNKDNYLEQSNAPE